MKFLTLFVAGLFACMICLSAWSQEVETGAKFPLPDETIGQLPSAVGRLAIQAIQGTPDAEPIRNSKVTIELYHRKQLYNTIEVQLDEFGVVVIDDLPLEMSTQPVVQVFHDEMMYQRIGTVMDAANPNQTIKVTCYDATDEQPPWTISMRHVMVDSSAEGLLVKEVIVIENPDDRTWLGTKTKDDKRVTTYFMIPTNAKNITLGKGFHDWCCTEFSGGKLINHLPLMPDTTEINFSYVVPIENSAAEIGFAAPVRVDHLMVVVPVEMVAEKTTGLELGGTEQIGERSVSYYKASNQQEGAVASISLTGLVAGRTLADDGLAMGPVKMVAAFGGGLLLLITIVVVFAKSPKNIANRS